MFVRCVTGAGGMSGKLEQKRSLYTQRGHSTLRMREEDSSCKSENTKTKTTSNNKPTKNKPHNQESNGMMRFTPLSNLKWELK